MDTKVTITFTGKDGKVSIVKKGTIRRFLSRIAHGQFLKCQIKVTYPDGGINDGEYDNKEDAELALRSFLENRL